MGKHHHHHHHHHHHKRHHHHRSSRRHRSQSPNKTGSFNKYRSFKQMRGSISEIINFIDGRRRILKFYKGSRNQMWFLRELVSVLPTLILYKSGIYFLISIQSKFFVPQYAFQNEVFKVAVPLLGQIDISDQIKDSVCELLIKAYDSQLLMEQQIQETSQTIISYSESNSFPTFTNLLISILKYFIIDVEFIELFFAKDIQKNEQHIDAYIYILNETNDLIYKRIVMKIYSNYNTFSVHPILSKLVCVCVERGPSYIITSIYDKIMQEEKDIFVGPKWEICMKICFNGPMELTEGFLLKIQNYISTDNFDIPKHFDVLFTSFISSISFIYRYKFLKRNASKINTFIDKLPMLKKNLEYLNILKDEYNKDKDDEEIVIQLPIKLR